MDSFYAQYLKERTDTQIYEDKFGFITYRYLPSKLYIVDIFVPREFRKDGHATRMADKIVKQAKEQGIEKLMGTVSIYAKNKEESLMVLFSYGLKIECLEGEFIVLGKDI